ncbi:rho guanine nucleotide exchange factor 2 isoform X2 [Nothobranchius furzeri]|uniref:rho guanine nucleotide exchange factor 2 isoform X2 n=1 Tax=Nothobranchius furzeri TaxID=105023 RepID=UPI0039048089
MIEDLKKDLMARQKDLESPTEYEESSDDELPSRNWSKAQRQIKPLIAENKRLKEDNFKHPIEAMKADIQQKDREVLELLQERVTLFSDLMQVTAREESGEDRCVETRTSCCRNLFRADTPHAPKAEQLLLAAIGEVSVDKLTTMLSSSGTQKLSVTNGNQEISSESPDTYGDCGSLNGSFKLNNSTSKDKNGNQLQEGALNREVHQRLVDLSTQLHALQAAVIRQDSILELAVGAGPISSTTSGSAPGPRLSRSMSRDTGLDASGEVVLLQRQVELLQEELARLRLKAEELNKKGSGTGKKKRGTKTKTKLMSPRMNSSTRSPAARTQSPTPSLHWPLKIHSTN